MPLVERPGIAAAAAVYLLVVLAIGVWSLRRTRGARDFFIAGQRIGLVVTALATMSAAFSGFVFVGGPGLMARIGFASLFIPLSVGLTSGMLCWLLARPLRRLAGEREVLTIPDAVLERYGDRRASGLAAVAVLVGTVGYLGAQLQALGVVVETAFGTERLFGAWSLPLAMAIGLAVVVFYSVAGGMIAGVYTDLLQGVVMLGAALAIFFHALDAGGGLETMARRIAGSPGHGPAFLDPMGGVPVATAVGFFFVFAVGVLGQPQMLHKFYMLDDPAKLRWFPLVLGLSQSLCILVWLGIGLAVPALLAAGELAPLAHPDRAAPVFLLEKTPELLAGLAFAGILAAIMSTADSFLNIGAAALVRDLPRALGRRPRDELRRGRWAVALLAIAAALFAWAYGDLVALLGAFAFGVFGAALAPALAVGLNWRRVGAGAATASIATGLGVTLVLEAWSRQSLWPDLPPPPLAAGMPPGALALAASFAVLFGLTAVSRRSRRRESPGPDHPAGFGLERSGGARASRGRTSR